MSFHSSDVVSYPPPPPSGTLSLRNLWDYLRKDDVKDSHPPFIISSPSRIYSNLPLVQDQGMQQAFQEQSNSHSVNSSVTDVDSIYQSPPRRTVPPHFRQHYNSHQSSNPGFGQARRASPEYSDKSLPGTPSEPHTPPEDRSIHGDRSEKAPAGTVSQVTEQDGPNGRPGRVELFLLHWLTAYRILMSITFAVNAVVFGVWVNDHHDIDFRLPGLLTATATNLFAAVVIRQEDVLNFAFHVLAKTPTTLPLKLRAYIADFHHFGGLHIGCAIASLMWYCLYVAASTINVIDYVEKRTMTVWLWIDIATSYAFMLFLFLICLTAIPRLRAIFHNTFEHTHRFAGWAALLVLWINSGISTVAHNTGSQSLLVSPAIWLLSIITFLIILPWTRMTKVPIHASLVSKREVRLTFPYARMPYTSTARFSLAPLTEWHAFATIPSDDGFTASVIISALGDWTKSILNNPPEAIWIRNPATANFLALTPMFRSVLLVATGAGIGPMLSLLASPVVAQMKREGRPVRVIWCVKDPNAPHWRFVQDIIRKVDSAPMIFDTNHGRPDVAFEARHAAQKHGIEAVMVVSNPKVTEMVVNEVKSQGGNAYGAVFDS